MEGQANDRRGAAQSGGDGKDEDPENGRDRANEGDDAFDEVRDPLGREVLCAEKSEDKGHERPENSAENGKAKSHDDFDERVPNGEPVRVRVEEDRPEVSQRITGGLQDVDAAAAQSHQAIDRHGCQHTQRDPHDPLGARVGPWSCSPGGQRPL